MRKQVIAFLAFTIVIMPSLSTGTASGNVTPSDFIMELPSGVRLGFDGDPATTMTVSWWTSSGDTDSTVHYGMSPGELQLVETGIARAVGTGFIHDVTLADLDPNTTYHYTCGGRSGNSSTYQFTTAPGGKVESVHFAAYGDTRTERTRRNVTRRMIMDGLGTEGDFVLHSGDIVAHGDSQGEYDNYSIDMQPLSANKPVMHVAGNHDYHISSTFYPDQFIEPSNGDDGWYYSFDWGFVHFMALNTEEMSTGNNDQAFLDWLENDLESASNDPGILWIVAWYHQPLYVSFSHEPRTDLWWTWNELFTEHDVDVTFAGHCHGYQRNYPVDHRGIIHDEGDPFYNDPLAPLHVVAGAGAVNVEGTVESDLRDNIYHAEWENGSKVFFPSNHFCNVEVTLDEDTMTTKLQMDVIGLEWTLPNITEENHSTRIVDRASITKPIPEGYFGWEPEPRGNVAWIVAVTAIISSASTVTAAVIYRWHRRKREEREKKKREEKRERPNQHLAS